MSAVENFLRGLRKAELQTIHQFWLPGESVQVRVEDLRYRIEETLVSGEGIHERVERLSSTQKRLIQDVLSRPDSKAPVSEVQEGLAQCGASRIEVESTVRQLTERGFVSRRREKKTKGPEILEIPKELASHLSKALKIGETVISGADGISFRMLPEAPDMVAMGIEERIQKLEDSLLAELCMRALRNRGVLDLDSDEIVEHLESEGVEEIDEAAWASILEEAGVGTIGSVRLQDYGITLPEPSLVIFQEWMKARSEASIEQEVRPDVILESGVDLLIDIERLTLHIEQEPIRLTRSGSFPKRLAEQLRRNFAMERLTDHLEGDTVTRVLRVAMKLGLVENFAGELRINDRRLEAWRGLDFRRKTEVVLQRFLEESAGARWSFHQEAMRSILLDTLREHATEGWVNLDGVIDNVVSTYLLELEEREVSNLLRQRREEDFSRDRLQCPVLRLGTDLAFWIVNRMLSLGMCEIGMLEGSLSSLMLTDLGRYLLGLESSPAECRVLVNPDFEIMLITEGIEGMALELQLARFSERHSAERIRRYRATPESMRLGVRAGFQVDEVRQVLESASDHPLPDPVIVAMRDWGRDVDWIQASPAIHLSGLKPDRYKQLTDILDEEKVNYLELGRKEVFVTGQSAQFSKGQLPTFFDRLKEEGWLVRLDGISPPDERGGADGRNGE